MPHVQNELHSLVPNIGTNSFDPLLVTGAVEEDMSATSEGPLVPACCHQRIGTPLRYYLALLCNDLFIASFTVPVFSFFLSSVLPTGPEGYCR